MYETGKFYKNLFHKITEDNDNYVCVAVAIFFQSSGNL